MGGSRRHPQMRAVKQVRGGTAFMIHPRGVGFELLFAMSAHQTEKQRVFGQADCRFRFRMTPAKTITITCFLCDYKAQMAIVHSTSRCRRAWEARRTNGDVADGFRPGRGDAGLWYGPGRVQIYCMPDLGDPGRQRRNPAQHHDRLTRHHYKMDDLPGGVMAVMFEAPPSLLPLSRRHVAPPFPGRGQPPHPGRHRR